MRGERVAVAPAGAPSGPGLGAVERVAWRIPVPSRRFFLALAVAAASAIVLANAAAAAVAARNAGAVADARDRSLRVATSVTEFRMRLGAADAEIASTLVSGEPETPLGRTRYQSDLLGAGLALTDAGLAATGESADDIAALADGLVRYAGLVETSRAYPAGSPFVDHARALAREDLVPRAERVRAAAEDELDGASARVGGPVAAVAIAALAAALAVLVASALLVAGRTRRLVHPALVAATLVLAAGLVVVAVGLWSQRRDLRTAAGGEIDAYVAANTTAFALLELRTDEMAAVASPDGGAGSYDRFRGGAEALLARLDGGGPDAAVLQPAVRAYADAVGEVEAADAAGDDAAAADRTLDGDSAIAFGEARGLAGATASRADRDLGERLQAAADADVEPPVPLGAGVVAAGLAAAGILARGRRYR